MKPPIKHFHWLTGLFSRMNKLTYFLLRRDFCVFSVSCLNAHRLITHNTLFKMEKAMHSVEGTLELLKLALLHIFYCWFINTISPVTEQFFVYIDNRMHVSFHVAICRKL